MIFFVLSLQIENNLTVTTEMRYAEALICRPNMLHFLQCVASRFVEVIAHTKHMRIDL